MRAEQDRKEWLQLLLMLLLTLLLWLKGEERARGRKQFASLGGEMGRSRRMEQ